MKRCVWQSWVRQKLLRIGLAAESQNESAGRVVLNDRNQDQGAVICVAIGSVDGLIFDKLLGVGL